MLLKLRNNKGKIFDKFKGRLTNDLENVRFVKWACQSQTSIRGRAKNLDFLFFDKLWLPSIWTLLQTQNFGWGLPGLQINELKIKCLGCITVSGCTFWNPIFFDKKSIIQAIILVIKSGPSPKFNPVLTLWNIADLICRKNKNLWFWDVYDDEFFSY